MAKKNQVKSPEEHAKELNQKHKHGDYIALKDLYARFGKRMPLPEEPSTVVLRIRSDFSDCWRPVCHYLLVNHNKMVVKVFDLDKKTGKRVGGYMIALPEEQAEIAGKKAFKKALSAMEDGVYKTAYLARNKMTKKQIVDSEAWNSSLNNSFEWLTAERANLMDELED